LPENGGFVQAAHSFEEHAAQLEHRSRDTGSRACGHDGVRRIIHSAGRSSRPATPIVVQALEELAQTKPEPVAAIPRRIVALRLVLLLFALPELPDHVRRLTRRKRKAVRTAAEAEGRTHG
jgi:hypothetical protein